MRMKNIFDFFKPEDATFSELISIIVTHAAKNSTLHHRE
jgi:hypothetical protein